MLNSVNNSSPSFGAKFIFEGCPYGGDRVKENVSRQPELAKNIVDFIKFIKSDEGRNLLEKMPEDDTIILKVPIQYQSSGRSEKLAVDMVYEKGKTFSEEKVGTGVDIEAFKKWADEIIKGNDYMALAHDIMTKFTIE